MVKHICSCARSFHINHQLVYFCRTIPNITICFVCLSIHSFSFLWILKIFPEHFFVTYILCLLVYMACVCTYMYICVCAYMYICVCIVFYMMCTAECRHLLIKVYKYQVLHLCFPLSKKKLKVIIIVTCNIIYSFLQHIMFFFL